MWETIKNDPILKTVAIIVLSVLGFGFAFNIMFGQRSNGMDGGMMDMGGGYSLENTLSYILSIGVKLLLIAVVIAAIIALFRFVIRSANTGGENKMFENTINGQGRMASSETKWNDQPMIKSVTIVLLSIVALSLILMQFSGIFGNGGMYGNTMGYQTSGIGLIAILGFLLKLLLFISVVGVIVGVFMFIKQNYFKQITETIGTFKTSDKLSTTCLKCGAKVSDEFKFCPSCAEKLKSECASCGIELKPEWKCCPGCGAEKV